MTMLGQFSVTSNKRLRKAGKQFKVAITAVMRKLLILANTLLKDGRAWSATPP